MANIDDAMMQADELIRDAFNALIEAGMSYDEAKKVLLETTELVVNDA